HVLPVLPSGLQGFVQVPVAWLHVPLLWHWSCAVQSTLFPYAPLFRSQASVCVQAFASLHVVPSGLAGFEQVPLAGLHVPASWHWSGGGQATRLRPVHTPVSQVSDCVQALPSLHGVPAGLAGFEQVPVAGLHVPVLWHWSWVVQTTAVVPVHTPVCQVSVCVQALPSLHVVPSGLAGFEQVPVAGLHVPASWHWSDTGQTTGSPPAHAPLWQVSVCVQALPSVHVLPSGLAGFEHEPVAGLHVPAS